MFQVRVEIKAIIASSQGVPWVNHPVRRHRDGKQKGALGGCIWLAIIKDNRDQLRKSRKIKTKELNAYKIADARRFGGCVDDFSSRLMLGLYFIYGDPCFA